MIQTFFNKILSRYQSRFFKGFNAQHGLVSIAEKWKGSVDNGGVFGTLMTEISKAFDCLHHELLIAKPDTYGFYLKSMRLVQQYLSKRKQKADNAYSSWKEICYGIFLRK